METFFRDYETTEVRLSPDGKSLAMIAPLKGRHNLLMLDLETMNPGWLTSFPNSDVHSINWASDERILLRLEQDGMESCGLFAINRDGKRPCVLAPALFRGDRVTQLYHPEFLSQLPNEPDHALVAAVTLDWRSSPDALSYPNVDRMHMFTGGKMEIVQNPGGVLRWLTDRHGAVRAGVAIAGRKLRLLYRASTNSDWKTLLEFGADEDGVDPISFAADNTNLLVTATHGRNTVGLYLFDVARAAIGECLWQHAEYDVDNVYLSPTDHRPLCVFYEDDQPRCQWFDARWLGIQASIDRVLTNRVNRIVNMSRDEKRAVFRSFSDRSPGTYYLYDATTRRLAKVREQASWIKEADMAPMRPISYKSRDNLTIHGYLTLPLGTIGTNLPLVVIPHGGPWVRDSWTFDPETQFLASRGYAVLQMNFRGSTGYGQAFLKAGFKQWGLKMQDDISDGVQWAIAQGIANKDRVAIYGASYGGYAALVGLTQTPELYKCGISYAGVTDITEMLAVDRYHDARRIGLESVYVGDSKTDKDQLKSTSPINHVDRIRAPLLLIHGSEDMRVRVSQVKRLASKLKAHDKTFEMILESEEGHGFHIEKNKIEMYRKMETFLQKNL